MVCGMDVHSRFLTTAVGEEIIAVFSPFRERNFLQLFNYNMLSVVLD